MSDGRPGRPLELPKVAIRVAFALVSTDELRILAIIRPYAEISRRPADSLVGVRRSTRHVWRSVPVKHVNFDRVAALQRLTVDLLVAGPIDRQIGVACANALHPPPRQTAVVVDVVGAERLSRLV